MTSFIFQLWISFSFYFGLSYNLFRVLWVVNVTLRSFKISRDLEGHIDIWGQWQGQCIFFLYRLISQFITPPILDRITSNFQLLSVKKELPVFRGITSSIYLNWNISIISCQIEIKLVLVKAEWQWLLFLKTFLYVTSGLAEWRH